MRDLSLIKNELEQMVICEGCPQKYARITVSDSVEMEPGYINKEFTAYCVNIKQCRRAFELGKEFGRHETE